MLANVCLQFCAGDFISVCFESGDKLLHGVSFGVGFVAAMGCTVAWLKYLPN
jgi:hypothetical protein